MRDVVKVDSLAECLHLRHLKTKLSREADTDKETDEEEQDEEESNWLEYEDDSRAIAIRADIEELNAGLNASTLKHWGQPVPPVHLIRVFHQRELKASPTWSMHGRLYWGFWIDMKRADRQGITIDGEPVVDLDYQACFLRLAYAHNGLHLPEGDPYAIPGLEGRRSAVKGLLSSLFFRPAKRPAKRFPKGYKEQMPEGWTMRRFTSAVALRHPGIANLLNSEVGWELFATESRILVEVLLRLLRQGVVALGCHDGLLAKVADRSLAERVMREVSMEVLGQELPVVLKPFEPVIRPPST